MSKEIKETSEQIDLEKKFKIYKNNVGALIKDGYKFLLKGNNKEKIKKDFLSLNIKADHEILENPKAKEFELYILDISKISGICHDISDKVGLILK